MNGDEGLDPAQEAEALTRKKERLVRLCGPLMIKALEDPATIEVMLNPDGSLWHEKLGDSHPQKIGAIDPHYGLSIIRQVAGILRRDVHALLEAKWPLDGSRFAGQIPPVVPGPTFAIRKHASRVFTLDQYVENGIMTQRHADVLSQALAARRNILVAGGTSSGKTTLLNALIAESVKQRPYDRFIIIEDTPELQCTAEDAVRYQTVHDNDPARRVTLSDLVETSLRMRPDRILVGEVRNKYALDMCNAWNTGHEGGLASIHANNAVDTLHRLKVLMRMHPDAQGLDLDDYISRVVHVIAHIAREDGSRKLRSIVRVGGYGQNGYLLENL